MAWMKRINWPLVLIVMLAVIFALPWFYAPGWAYGETYAVSSLPYNVGAHSGDDWDTLVISGTLVSDNDGIVFPSSYREHYVITGQGTGRIEFGKDITTGQHGETFWLTSVGVYLRNTDNIIIEDLEIIHTPYDGETPIDSSTAYSVDFAGRGHNYCIATNHSTDSVTITGVDMIIRGYGGDGGEGSGCIRMEGGKNWLIDDCRMESHITAFQSRTQFQSNAIHAVHKNPLLPDTANGGFNLTLTNSYLTTGHIGLLMNSDSVSTHTATRYFVKVDACSLMIDARNDMYAVESGTGESATNAYAMFLRSIGGGSVINDNYVWSGDNYNGGRGLGMIYCEGESGKPIEITNNYMDHHEGSTTEFYTRYYPGAIKLRQHNKYVDLNNNVFICRFDTAATFMTGYWYMGEAVTIEPEFGCDGNDGPYYINFVNNTCSSIVNTPIDIGTYYEVSILKFESTEDFTEVDSTIVVYGNNLYTNGKNAYDFGQFDIGAEYIRVEADTVSMSDAQGLFEGTYNLGWYLSEGVCPESGCRGEVARDITYLNAALDTNVVHQYQDQGETPNGAYEMDIQFQRTFAFYVYGNNALPVANAACSVWNTTPTLVLNGATNADGLLSGIITYYHDRDVAGDIDYNDFSLQTISPAGTDTATNAAFTMGYTAGGGVDTLVLSDTEGASPSARTKLRGFKP